MHGGKGSGAPEGNRNAWKHGGRSADTLAAACYMREIARLVDDELGQCLLIDLDSKTSD